VKTASRFVGKDLAELRAIHTTGEEDGLDLSGVNAALRRWCRARSRTGPLRTQGNVGRAAFPSATSKSWGEHRRIAKRLMRDIGFSEIPARMLLLGTSIRLMLYLLDILLNAIYGIATFSIKYLIINFYSNHNILSNSISKI